MPSLGDIRHRIEMSCEPKSSSTWPQGLDNAPIAAKLDMPRQIVSKGWQGYTLGVDDERNSPG